MKLSTIHYMNHISEIPNLGSYDFVASALTSWQFDVMLAYIQSHQLTNGGLIVEAIPFIDVVKYRLSEDQVLKYEGLFNGVYFCQSRKQPYVCSHGEKLIQCFGYDLCPIYHCDYYQT